MERVSNVKLFAKTLKDLKIISTLCQDSVGNVENIRWSKREKSFSVHLNRFRWELLDLEEKRPKILRISSILFFRWVLFVKSKNINKLSFNKNFSLLNINYINTRGNKRVILIFSGGAEISLEVEYLEVFLKDIGSTYSSISEKIPYHNNH